MNAPSGQEDARITQTSHASAATHSPIPRPARCLQTDQGQIPRRSRGSPSIGSVQRRKEPWRWRPRLSCGTPFRSPVNSCIHPDRRDRWVVFRARNVAKGTNTRSAAGAMMTLAQNSPVTDGLSGPWPDAPTSVPEHGLVALRPDLAFSVCATLTDLLHSLIGQGVGRGVTRARALRNDPDLPPLSHTAKTHNNPGPVDEPTQRPRAGVPDLRRPRHAPPAR